MAGRVDDYLKSYCKDNSILVEPEILEWAGVAIVKRCYEIYQSEKYSCKLLVAAFRNPYHWNQFIGGDLVLTIPYEWQLKYATYDFEITNTINDKVDTKIIDKLLKLDEFKKAYEIDGMSMADFEHYGAFKVTINQFLAGYDELCCIIRSFMVQ